MKTITVVESSLKPQILFSFDEEDRLDPDNEIPANAHAYDVSFASSGDADKWIEYRNEYLSRCWTPNQSDEERRENKKRGDALLDLMSFLEVGHEK